MTKFATFRKERPSQVVPLSAELGAELHGCFIQGDLDDEDLEFIQQALLKYHVVFFRNQHQLTDQSHRDFARSFGDIAGHPTVGTQEDQAILELHSHRGGRANSWHTDVTFDLRPPKLSILRAVTLPDLGGDTAWANTVAAYEHLPDTLKALADKLWAVHGNDFDYAASRVELLHDDVSKSYRRQYAAQVIKSEHPVVRVIPTQAKKACCSATTPSALWAAIPTIQTVPTRSFRHMSPAWKTPSAGIGLPVMSPYGTTAPPSTTRSTTTEIGRG